MKIDIVIPKNNEQEILDMAIQLGFKELIFLYTDLNKKPLVLKSDKIKLYTAGLAMQTKDVDKAGKNYDFVFGPAQRAFFENKKIKYLVNAETDEKKDFLYQKRAGLDDVMCRLAKEKNQIIVFNMQIIAEKPLVLARMVQNAKLCRKYKVDFLAASFATSPLEMRSPIDIDGFSRMIKLL
ncbi:MAG: hypothetical protein KKF46_08090 [Nanoarchaeota archaeon]|nr:hypothetical protein [Nanoarchaeota archaeon]MBU1322288.1 hypothetical protein [Nanoarchaeota archaeon]MBU1597827.1 hypothetical protein [Nanoarchaeota archaeon]MBU2441080.1 hypothetical protein [Nanoarchaeota archaeon]